MDRLQERTGPLTAAARVFSGWLDTSFVMNFDHAQRWDEPGRCEYVESLPLGGVKLHAERRPPEKEGDDAVGTTGPTNATAVAVNRQGVVTLRSRRRIGVDRLGRVPVSGMAAKGVMASLDADTAVGLGYHENLRFVRASTSLPATLSPSADTFEKESTLGVKRALAPMRARRRIGLPSR